MAALVQAYIQQSSTVTMLQTRPSSSSGIIHTSQTPSQYPSAQSTQRNSFHGLNTGGIATTTYRGHTTMAPIAPYAFTSTPHLRSDMRTSSAPIVPNVNNAGRSRYPAAASISTTSSTSSSDVSSGHKSGTKDDSAVTGTARVVSGTARPHSVAMTSSSTPGQLFSMPSTGAVSPVKATPDRYRRPNNRRVDSSTSSPPVIQSVPSPSTAPASVVTMPNVMQFYGTSTQQQHQVPVTQYNTSNPQMPQSAQPGSEIVPGPLRSADDSALNRHISQDQAKRYRRRSIHTIDPADYGGMSGPFLDQGSRQINSANGRINHQQQHPLRSSPVVGVRPGSAHGRNISSDSIQSVRSNHSRTSSVSHIISLFTPLRNTVFHLTQISRVPFGSFR